MITSCKHGQSIIQMFFFFVFFQCLKLGNGWVHQDLEIAVQLKDCYVMRTTPVSFFSIFISGAQVAQRVRLLDITAHTSLSPIWHGFAPRFVNYKKWCTRLAAASDKQHAHRFFHLGVHVPFYLHFWGYNL